MDVGWEVFNKVELEESENKKATDSLDHDLLMEHASWLMKKLKKIDKKKKSKDKEKKKKKKSKKRRLSDASDEESEPGSSKRRRKDSSSPGTRDTSPTNVRESFSSDAIAGSSWQLDTPSEPDSPIRLTETCRKVADLRNKIEERERAKKRASNQHSSDESVNKERRLISPRGSRDRQLWSSKERDPRDRNVRSPRERESDRYGHSSRESIFRGSRDGKFWSPNERKSDRYGYSYRDSIPRGSRDSPKERDSKERHVRSPRERESDRYGHSSRDSRRSPLGREPWNRSRFSVERDRRRRSSEERVQRSHYPRSPERKDLEMMSPRNRIYTERYSRRDGDRYASSSRSSVLVRRSPSLRDTARSSRERDIKPGYISKHRAITYRPNVSESIISEMNHHHERNEDFFAKKEGETKTIKKENKIVESEIDEAVRRIIRDKYEMIDESAFKFRVRYDARENLLQYLKKAIKYRFSTLMISGNLSASQMILRYRCKYTEVMDTQLITKLFHIIVAARDKDKLKADIDAEVDDIIKELEVLAHDVTSVSDIKTEADDDADEDEGVNVKLNVVHSEKASNEHLNLAKHIKIEEPDMPEESDTVEDQDMSMVSTENIKVDLNRRKKYFITIRILLKCMKKHMEKYRNRIDLDKFEYVIRHVLETRITGLLVNMEERLKAKALYAFYRQSYRQDADGYFIKKLVNETREGRYNNVEEAAQNAEIAAVAENDPTEDGEIEPVVKMEVKEEPVPDPSIEVKATSTGTFLSGNIEEVFIKKEPITEETASGAEKDNSKDTMEIDTTPVVNVTVKSEPVTDQETNDQQNIASNTNCANNGTDLVVKPIKKEPEAKDNDNKKEIADKSGNIQIISVEIKKEPVNNQMKVVQKKSDSDAKEKELVTSNVNKTEKQIGVITTPIKQEPKDDNAEKCIATPVIKKVPEEIAKTAVSKAAKVTIPIPKLNKPELKPLTGDDGYIMGMREFIEPKNEDTIQEEQTTDTRHINVSNEAVRKAAKVTIPIPKLINKPELKPLTGDDDDTMGMGEFIKPKNEDNIQEEQTADVRHINVSKEAVRKAAKVTIPIPKLINKPELKPLTGDDDDTMGMGEFIEPKNEDIIQEEQTADTRQSNVSNEAVRKATKVTIPIPKLINKPELKPLTGDDDDIMGMGEFIEPKNEDTIQEEKSADVRQSNVSNEAVSKAAKVTIPIPKLVNKPELKPLTGDDDDTMGMGEFIETKNDEKTEGSPPPADEDGNDHFFDLSESEDTIHEEKSADVHQSNVSNEAVSKAVKVTIAIHKLINKPECLKPLTGDNDGFIEPKNDVKSEGSPPPADEDRNDDVIDLTEPEDTVKGEQSADVRQTNVSNEAVSKAAKVTIPIPKLINKPELKPLTGDDGDIMGMKEFIEPKNDEKSEGSPPPADEDRSDDVIDLTESEDTIHEEQSADVRHSNVYNEGEFECAEVGQPHNLSKDSTIDISPNKTTSTGHTTDVDNIKSAQTGNHPSIDESIEVSDDDDFGDNTNIEAMEEQNMTDESDSNASVDTVILERKINVSISLKNSNLQQKNENINAGRANVSPDRAVDKQRATAEAPQSDSKHRREEVSKTCGEGDIFDEADESIESIKNFLNTQMCAMP